MARWITGEVRSHRKVYAALFAVLIALALSLWLGERHELFFEVRLSSSIDDVAQLFFDVGRGYNEQDSSTAAIQQGQARTYRFRLPAKRIYSLRFDVLSRPGRVTIFSGRIVDENGNSFRTFTASDFGPRLHFQVLQRAPLAVTLQTVQPPPGQALDPSAYIFNSALDPKFGFSLVHPLLWFCLFVVLFSLAVIGYWWLAHHWNLQEQDSVFRLALICLVIFNFIHFACLPLMVSFDGMDYVRLANLPLSPSFLSGWRFLRTPLFPLTLKGAFWFGGEQPEAALMVTTLLGMGAAVLVGAAVRKIAGGIAGAAALVVLMLYPVLVGYQHMLLSETGTFFWLALLVWSVVTFCKSRKRKSLWFAAWIAIVLALGYYWRPTIQYLSPLIALVYALGFVTSSTARNLYDLLGRLRLAGPRIIGGALIVAAGPWMLAYPWIHLAQKYAPGIAEGTVTAGMYKQVLVPPSDPLLGPLESPYETAIRQDSRNGHLPIDGVSIVGRMALLEQMGVTFEHAGLIHLIEKYPLRYVTGVAKSMVFFLGVPDHGPDDENWHFSRAIFGQWPASETLDESLGWDRTLPEFRPVSYTGGSLLGRLLTGLLPWYTAIVLTSSIVSIGLLLLSIKRLDAVTFAMTSIPLAFLLLHALTLMSAARYAFPVYPLMIANLIMSVSLAYQAKRRKRNLRHDIPVNRINTAATIPPQIGPRIGTQA